MKRYNRIMAILTDQHLTVHAASAGANIKNHRVLINTIMKHLLDKGVNKHHINPA